MTQLKNSQPLMFVMNGLLDMAFPELCLLCNVPLHQDERCICHDCSYHFPKTNYTSYTENDAACLFYGKLPFVKATSGFNYYKDSPIQSAIELLKYRGKKELGQVLGSMVSLPLQRGGFFNGIDVLVPVPLHPAKRRKRGYNQSEWIAKGIADITGLPINTAALLRESNTKTQTRKHVFERWRNVAGVFTLNHPEAFAHKHILLIDDVLTSGSTLEACGQTVLNAHGAQVSFLTLAKA